MPPSTAISPMAMRACQGCRRASAAAICGHVIRRQAELGISGDMVEIGTFEGRFFIAMALGPRRRRTCARHRLRFDWPDDGVQDAACRQLQRRWGSRAIASSLGRQTRAHACRRWRAAQVCGSARRASSTSTAITRTKSLSHDLELAHQVLHPAGVIALDDMLHPGYPTLISTVLDYLNAPSRDAGDVHRRPRGHFSGGEVPDLPRRRGGSLRADLMKSFARFHFIGRGRVMGRVTLVLTPSRSSPISR